MTHPSIGTLESFNYHTSGMRCWQDHLSYISNNAITSGMVVTLNPPTSQMVVTINPPYPHLMPITSGRVVTINPPTNTGS